MGTSLPFDRFSMQLKCVIFAVYFRKLVTNDKSRDPKQETKQKTKSMTISRNGLMLRNPNDS